ncbi:flagellar motility protein MotE (MotC chaperone) [Pullulanibacillus pueri]|uniref:Magnesium transporter MgtE intracellular domain-containing protein n=1 Tax=Pullulanibacillus pueri TaxID=1437324 RepID=A0A8J2ZX23_9BACL|nr:hypothetical protein [Pullulanibacillus pueri]MBM7682479.1 flagellar motility protein MotE (MotC chaperone) [Pullulanibacillus pueri]GGH82234.1 hypothetical protein GCM10007096_21320 [Pullulanibacillus pueri]
MSEQKESRIFKFLKGLLVIIIPLLFIFTMVVLFLKISGFDLSSETRQWATHIPVVSQFVDKKGTANQKSVSNDQADETKALKKQLSNARSEVKDLNKQMSTKDEQIKALNDQIDKLKSQEEQTSETAVNEEEQAKMKVIAQTYQNMDTEKAAAIFNQMSNDEAAKYINMLNNKTKAEIMENLSPQKAAKLTPLLESNSTTTDADSGS